MPTSIIERIEKEIKDLLFTYDISPGEEKSLNRCLSLLFRSTLKQYAEEKRKEVDSGKFKNRVSGEKKSYNDALDLVITSLDKDITDLNKK